MHILLPTIVVCLLSVTGCQSHLDPTLNQKDSDGSIIADPSRENQAPLPCGSTPDIGPDTTIWPGDACSNNTSRTKPDVPPGTTTGELVLMTYNIAGLPQGLSGSNPEKNIPLISPLLNSYDLVLLQEDFWYHDLLTADVNHPYQSPTWSASRDASNIGDGLNRLSWFPFGEVSRTPWPGCNGLLDCSSDCLATKGFSVARHTLSPIAEVDIYNLHMEAGGCPEDVVIRDESIQLLIQTVKDRSGDVAVIMAGDFNLHEADPVELAQLTELLEETGLKDACWETGCTDARIDRILLRDSGTVSLEPTHWEVPPEFKDENGLPLSDHAPVIAHIRWTVR